MDLDNENLPSIIYTSDDSAETGQSDDSADVNQSDDSNEVLQSDDSDEPTFIAPNVCTGDLVDESRQCLLDAASDGGEVSPAIAPPFSLCHPLTGVTCSSATPLDRQPEVCSVMTDISDDTASNLSNVPGGQQLYLPGVNLVGDSRSPSPSGSSTQSLGSQEALGLLSLHHQYQPLCGGQQAVNQQHTTVHYAPFDPDHNITTKIGCDPLDSLNKFIPPTNGVDPFIGPQPLMQVSSDRWLVADMHIDARYKDAFYVQWNWHKIRSFCAMINFAVLLALLVMGVALLVQMPHGHECDPLREWWQGRVSYHVLVPSFKDTNGDGIGDMQGVVAKLDYIQGLGVTMLRLAPLFEAAERHYDRVLVPSSDLGSMHRTYGPPGVVWNLTRVSPTLGSSGEIQLMAALLHERNMKLILDLPLAPGIPTIDVNVPGISAGWSSVESASSVVVKDALAEAKRGLDHWIRLGVDGFSFPDLHHLLSDDDGLQIVEAVESWRSLLDRSPRVGVQQRILILPTELLQSLPHAAPERFASPVESDDTQEMHVNELKRHVASYNEEAESGAQSQSNGTQDDDEVIEFTLLERLLRAAHLLEEHLQLAASPTAVMKQVEATLKYSTNPSSPWILWSMSGIGIPRLSELAPIGMRFQPQYHQQSFPNSRLVRNATEDGGDSVNRDSQHGPHHLSAGNPDASVVGLHHSLGFGSEDGATFGKRDLDDNAASQTRNFWSSVGRNFLLMFLPGSTSLYYGDEVDVTAPTDMKDLGWAGIMAWSDDSFGGFSSQQPWLGLDDHYQWHNVHNRLNTSVAELAELVQHKQQQPPLFINWLSDNNKGDYQPGHLSNTKVRYMDDSLLILDRYYPRRRQYMMIANLGTERIQRDLSHYYYGGRLVASSHGKSGYIKFRNIVLVPSEVLVCSLDK